MIKEVLLLALIFLPKVYKRFLQGDFNVTRTHFNLKGCFTSIILRLLEIIETLSLHGAKVLSVLNLTKIDLSS